MEKSLRLRLVVQRNGVPDVRILFNVLLANEPTVSQLLEQVNETVPLEDAHGEWGLDDYVVELHDKSGHAFECLHFQPVATVLDRDDEVFIRPLSTLDLKKRRLGGRDQILNGGEHLIDGVPFGRHRLRAPRGRPAIHIAPRKRRRLNYDQDHDVDDLDNYFNKDEDIDDYTGPRPRHQDDNEEEEERLLLTQFGDTGSNSRTRRVHFPANATVGAELEDSEEDADEEPVADEEDEEDDAEDEDTFNPDSEELAEELRDLRALAEEEARGRSPSEADGHERFHTPNEDTREHTEDKDVSSLGDDDTPGFKIRSAHQTRSQSLASQKSGGGYSSQEPYTSGPEAVVQSSTSSVDPSLLDKIMAIRSAYPQVSSIDSQKLLMKHGKDVSRTWRALEKSLKPRLGLAETMVLNTQLELPREITVVSSPARELAGHLGEVSRIDEDEDSDLSSDEEENIAVSASSSNERDDSDDSDSDSDSDSSSALTPTQQSPQAKRVVRDSSQGSSDSSSSDSDSDSPSEDDDHAPTQDIKNVRPGQKPARKVASSESSSDEISISSSSSDSESPVTRRTKTRSSRRMIVQSPQSSPASSKVARDTPKKASARTKKPSSPSKKSANVEESSSSSDSDSSSCPMAQAAIRRSAHAASKTTFLTKSDFTPTTQTSTQPSVPPGQGKTRTQRRNQRRRLENQRKKAALETARSDYYQTEDSIMIDALIAKRIAILKSLESQSEEESEGARDASLPADEISKSVDTPSNGANDWKQKISYRAVECVQEGIVDISEPPFPFYQRWDPQLQQDFRVNSQRKSKRKARDSSQFYDPSSQPSHKKRKEDEHSRQVVDEYSYQEDTTTFLANQDDVTLNYDDDTFNAENGHSQATKNQAAADDLPQLPEDMSSLPELLSNHLGAGAIVTWKQLLCTEATNWQPQMSEYMTAVVIEADCVKGHLQVQLAKRDRDVEKNEKKFDEETGQRIYGKFEVPDDEDEDEEDQGFRDLTLSQMMYARLVQPAEQPQEKQTTSVAEEPHSPEDQNGDAPPDQAPQLSELEFEVADSQPKQINDEVSGTSGSDQNQSKTLDHDSQSRKNQETQDESQNTDVNGHSDSGAIDESFIDETMHDVQQGDEDNNNDVDRISPVDELSITNERREEISQLMKAEGFRQEVRSSIDQSGFLRLGSPSRQLEEEYASSLHKASSRAASSEAPSEYGSKDPSQQMNQQSLDVDLEAFHSAPQTPGSHQISSDGPEIQQTEELIDSTTGLASLRLKPSQATEVSAQSGRQPDDNFVTQSDDLGVEPLTDTGDVAFIDEDDDTAREQSALAQTPTQQSFNDDLQTATATKAGRTQSEPDKIPSSPHGSVRSSASSGSFPDIQVLWEQLATKKFKETPSKIKNEQSSQINLLVESPAQPVRAASPREDVKDEFWSSPARSTRSSGKGKGNDSTNSTPKAKLRMTTFDASVSPPTFSKARRKSGPRASLASQKKVQNPSGKGKAKASRASGSTFAIPEGSQVVSLMTSSPEPEPEPEAEAEAEEAIREPEDEPEYTEMYAEDSFDDDYHGDSYSSQRPSQKTTRRVSKSRGKRGASVPVAESSRESPVRTNWVPGSQGPSRKASGRFGGRWSIGL